MTDYLKTLKSTIDDVVIEANGGRAEDPLVDYILTVPELWESNERESLRECAAEALLGYGSMKEAVAIIGEQSVQQSLQLIVESEALVTFIVASIPPTGVEKGDLFLICDAGGWYVNGFPMGYEGANVDAAQYGHGIDVRDQIFEARPEAQHRRLRCPRRYPIGRNLRGLFEK